MNEKVKGYILGIISAATYGMNPLFTLPLYERGMNPDSVLFLRYLLAIPIVGIMLKARGRSLKLRKNEILPLIVMGFIMAFSSLALFQSYNYMDSGIASTILFVYPILVAIFMAIFFKEKITLQSVLCILLTMGGIALLYRGDNGVPLSTTGLAWVFMASLAYAIYIVGINRPRFTGIATLKVTFYVLLFGVFLFFFRISYNNDFIIINEWEVWLNIIALAIFPTAISFLCTTSAVKYIGSTPTAILGALEPVTALILGVTIFKETMTPTLILGVIMIITAVTVIIAGNSISSQLIRLRKLFPKIIHRGRK